MNVPQRLLELSRTMATLEPKRPRQTTLRRAISTAYYSVFHLLTSEYAALFSKDPAIQAAIARTVNHKDVVAVARDFSLPIPTLPESLKSLGTIPPELQTIAKLYLELIDERHDADYDLSQFYTRSEVFIIVAAAQEIFAHWDKCQSTPAATLFLACFQLKKAWNEKR